MLSGTYKGLEGTKNVYPKLADDWQESNILKRMGSVWGVDFSRDRGSRILDRINKPSDFPILNANPSMVEGGVAFSNWSVTDEACYTQESSYDAEEDAAKITISASTDTDDIKIGQTISGINAGDKSSLCVYVKTSGNVTFLERYDIFGSGSRLSYTSGSWSAYTNWTRLELTVASADVGADEIRISHRFKVNNPGDTGTLWIKTCEVRRIDSCVYGYSNLISQYADMDTDTDGSGEVDGFGAAGNNYDGTFVRTLDDDAQKMTISGGTNLNEPFTYIYTQDVYCGEYISGSVMVKVTGDVKARIALQATSNLQGAGVSGLTSAYVDSEEWVSLKVEGLLCASGTLHHQLKLRIAPNASGSEGSVWFKQARVVRAPTINRPRITSTIYGATPTPSAFSFDGTDDYVDITNSSILDLTDSLSLFVIFKLDSLASGYDYIICRNHDSGVQSSYALLVDTNKALRFSLEGSYYATDTIVANKWYICVATWDRISGVTKLYLNGVLKDTNTSSPTTVLTSRPNCNIGRRFAGYYFNGKIAKVYAFNRALTGAEVTQLYKMNCQEYK